MQKWKTINLNFKFIKFQIDTNSKSINKKILAVIKEYAILKKNSITSSINMPAKPWKILKKIVNSSKHVWANWEWDKI